MLENAVFLKVLFLGIVEGLTEFIPVSSTAHLLIFSRLIEFNEIKNNLFEIAIQFGGVLAICVYYRKKIIQTIFEINKTKQKNFAANILIAFLPAVFLGLLFHKQIKEIFFSNFAIAIAMISGGIAILIIESLKNKFRFKSIDSLNFSTTFLIGIFQCLAMIPGVSRSGATILGAMLLGVDRKIATEFSFFLAIPTIGSACLYDIYKNIDFITFSEVKLIIIGIISSFITSIIVIKWLTKYVSKNDFKIFGFYRIVIGIMILIFFME